jgi:hypothetical protein
MKNGRSFDSAIPPRTWPTHFGRVPPRCPEQPSITTCRHQQQPANMKLGQALNSRATHGDTLVMRSSLGGDKDQGAEVTTVVRDRRRRARCAPDRPAG